MRIYQLNQSNLTNESVMAFEKNANGYKTYKVTWQSILAALSSAQTITLGADGNTIILTKPDGTTVQVAPSDSTKANATDVYTKTEINGIISAINQLNIEIVQTLPTTNIDTHTFYFVPKQETGTQDVYDEFVNTDGTTAGWEKIGTTQIDLSQYYTKTQIDNMITQVSGDLAVLQGLLNNHTVLSDVPANAVFTDTVYDDTALSGRVTQNEGDIANLEEKTSNLGAGTTFYDFAPQQEMTKQLGVNAENVKVKIEPQQDLHGYDYPWAGGNGKNKLLPAPIANPNTSANVTYTTNADGSVLVNGTATETSVHLYLAQGALPLIQGQSYIISCLGLSEANLTLDFFGTDVDNPQIADWSSIKINISQESVEFILSHSYKYYRFNLIAASGSTRSNVTVYPMIRLATETDPTFEPYSNNCSITGFDTCEISRVGKNRLPITVDDIKAMNGGASSWTNNSKVINGVNYTLQTDAYGNFIGVIIDGTSTEGTYFNLHSNVVWNGQYTISGLSGTAYESYYQRLIYSDDTDVGVLENDITFTANGKQGRLQFVINGGVTISNVLYKPMIRPATESDSTFEPYRGRTYTINLGGTIYGGELDVTNGRLVVDRAYTTYSASDVGMYEGSFSGVVYALVQKRVDSKTRNNYKSEKLTCDRFINGNGTPLAGGAGYIRSDADMTRYFIGCPPGTTREEARTIIDGMQLVYELATPFTVQLTPQQIQLLSGYNFIEANTGDIAITTNDIEGAIGQADRLIEGNTQAIRENDSFNDSIFGPVETGTTASQAYAQGDYFIKDKKMCKALTSIAQGATFTLGTNYAAYTLADILKAIENA